MQILRKEVGPLRTECCNLVLVNRAAGWSSPKENQAPAGASKGQLYDMAVDSGETTNLYDSRPEIVKRLLGQLKSDIERGRSTDGADAKNDLPDIVLWKSEQKPGPGDDKKNSRYKGAPSK